MTVGGDSNGSVSEMSTEEVNDRNDAANTNQSPTASVLDPHATAQVINGGASLGTQPNTTKVVVTPNAMQAMVELTGDNHTWKALVKTKVKDNIWRICKLPSGNGQSSKRMKAPALYPLFFNQLQ